MSEKNMKLKRRIAIRAAQIFAVGGAFLAGTVLVPGVANAYTGSYNASTAINYAVKYSCNGNTSCRNSAYKANDNDCANFVSQALYAAGLKQDGTWNYNTITRQISQAWGTTTNLAYWLNDNASWKYDGDPSAAVGPAAAGSVVQYDWGGGEGWSHTALLTGTGAYANYYDSSLGGYYKDLVKNNYGDRVTQHSTDRDGSPWELGYWTYNVTWRANARVRYLYPFVK